MVFFDAAVDQLGNVYTIGLELDVDKTFPRFLAKYDANGTLQWTLLFPDAFIAGVSADGLGNVYVAGGDKDSAGDSFLAKYDANGTFQANVRYAKRTQIQISDVSADGMGNIYFAGETFGNLGGTHAGQGDAVLVKFVDLLAADLNDDGMVDAADYVVWRRGLGTTYTEAGYDLWKATFGATASSATSLNATIPEPATAVLVVASVLSFVVLMSIAPRCIHGKARTEGTNQ